MNKELLLHITIKTKSLYIDLSYTKSENLFIFSKEKVKSDTQETLWFLLSKIRNLNT